MRLRVLLAAIVVSVFPLAFIGGSPVNSAGASVGCYGDYCSGKDPVSTGCANGAITVSATNFAGGRLELRWSPICKSNWARMEIYPGGFAYTLSAVQDTGYSQNEQWAAGTPGPGTYWTYMIYSPVHRVQARATGTCYGLFDCAVNGQIQTNWG